MAKLKTMDTDSIVIDMLSAQSMEPGPSNSDPKKRKARHFGFYDVTSRKTPLRKTASKKAKKKKKG